MVQNISLPYESDILYSAGESKLNEPTKDIKTDATYFGYKNKGKFFITPLNDTADSVITFKYGGTSLYLSKDYVNSADSEWYQYGASSVHLVLYLKREIKIVSRTSTEEAPFILE